MNCPAEGKRRFEAAGDARKALASMKRRHQKAGRYVYWCRDCQGYHLAGAGNPKQAFKLQDRG